MAKQAGASHHACAVPAWRQRAAGRRHRTCEAPAVVPTPPYVRGSRSSNHESRITNHGSSTPLGVAVISNDRSARVVTYASPAYSSSSGIPDSRSEDRRISPCRILWPSQKSDESELRQLSTSPGRKYTPKPFPIRPRILPPPTPSPTNFPQNPARAPEMRYTGPYKPNSRPRPCRN